MPARRLLFCSLPALLLLTSGHPASASDSSALEDVLPHDVPRGADATARESSKASPTGAADDSADDPAPSPPMRWYGWQTLALGGASLLLMGASSQSSSPGAATVLFVPGFLGYIAGGPAVHGFHHRDGALLADLGLRIALPLLSGAAAIASEHCSPEQLFCPLAQAMTGAAVGAGAAVLVDALLLSWDPRTTTSPADDARGGWSPTVAVGPRGVTAGIGGAF